MSDTDRGTGAISETSTPTGRPIVLVTGGAGNLGTRIVDSFVAAGCVVVSADVAPHRVSLPGAAVDVRMDTTDPQQVVDTVRWVESELGPIVTLVNCAAIAGGMTSSMSQSPEEALRVLQVNAFGTFVCTQTVGNLMAGRGSGCIITVASSSAGVLKTGQAAYGASKAAARYITNAIGLELAPSGVRCLVVSPGTVDEAMGRARRDPSRQQELLQGNLQQFRTGVPLGRLTTAHDVASLVVFLSSTDAEHITCTEIRVDGGSALLPD